jgi:shikimate 5-dehydrogenase
MNVQNAINWQHAGKLFVSLAANPGKTGEQVYNTLFKHQNIDAEYVACECTDLASDMELVRRHCAGASITMPFKKQVEKYIDMSWTSYAPINTVVNKDGFLTGYNCDLMGLKEVLGDKFKDKKIVLLGTGAMATNVKELCTENDICEVQRNNWHLRHTSGDILINTTSIGMGTNESPVDVINASMVVDCVIGDTELIKQAHRAGKAYITGSDIYIAQFKYQFKLYTGQDADEEVLKVIAKKVFDV